MKKYLEEGDGGIILLGETGVAGGVKPEEPTEGVVRPGQHALAIAGYLAAVAVLVPRRPNSQFKTRPQRLARNDRVAGEDLTRESSIDVELA